MVTDAADDVAHRAAVLDAQRAGAEIADSEITRIGPGRAGASYRSHAGRTGVEGDHAVGVGAHRAAVLDAQRTGAGMADTEAIRTGPGRAGNGDRHRAGLAGIDTA